MEEKSNIILYPCRNWSNENNCCKGFYDSIINQKFEFVKVSIEDLDKNCKGKSNCSLCVWFLYDRYTMVIDTRKRRYD